MTEPTGQNSAWTLNQYIIPGSAGFHDMTEKPIRPRIHEVHFSRGTPSRRSELRKLGFVWNQPSNCWILAEGYDAYTLAWGTYDLSTNQIFTSAVDAPRQGCVERMRKRFETFVKSEPELPQVFVDEAQAIPDQVWFAVDPGKGKDKTAVVLATQEETLPANNGEAKFLELPSIHTANSPAVVAHIKPASTAPALAMHSWPPKGAQRIGLFLP